jgi:hypothetical protein
MPSAVLSAVIRFKLVGTIVVVPESFSVAVIVRLDSFLLVVVVGHRAPGIISVTLFGVELQATVVVHGLNVE